LFSRFLYGIQGGMSCSMIPTYLAEVSPASLRGQAGVINQLLITFGILFGQLLCFKEILGNESTWNFLLAIPGILAVFGGLALLLFFPDTPRNLLIKNRDEAAAVFGKMN
jgi:MFS family permease